MLQIKGGYRRRYAYGGRGLFDTVTKLLGRAFTSSAAKTLGAKALTAATDAAVKGVEKGATKAVDHVVKKLTAPQKTQQKARFKAITQPKSNLHNLIAGSGIATIHDFVRTYK